MELTVQTFGTFDRVPPTTRAPVDLTVTEHGANVGAHEPTGTVFGFQT